MRYGFISVVLLFLASGCSDDAKETASKKIKQDHIWKGQTQVLERAEGVEKMVIDAARDRQGKIEQRTQ